MSAGEQELADRLLPEPFPPPYRAMLAISSDVECTSWPAQLDLIEIFGRRGIEVGFSYWCFGDEQMTWRLFDEDGRPAAYADAAMELIRAGVLDTLHSFGGITDGRGVRFDRGSMLSALEALREQGLRTRVYTNHGTRLDIQNIGGSWASYQQGDVPESPAYHLDASTGFGASFFWTDIDYDNQRPYFALNRQDERSLLVPQRGRDGTPILRFRRYRGAFNRAPYAGNLGEQLNHVLSHEPEGYSVVYQHLGVQRLPDGTPIPTAPPYFDPAGFAAIDRLAELDRRGVQLVTTTERLLMHALLMQARPWTLSRDGERITVRFEKNFRYEDVPFELSACDLNGWFLAIHPGQTVVARLGDAEWELPTTIINDQLYAGIPWERLPVLDALERAKAIAGSGSAR